MDLKIDTGKLKSSHETPFLVVDVFMMFLILVNLAWLLFDTLFASELVQRGLFQLFPRFTDYYGTFIHPNFIVYDLGFVAIFLAELLIRWLIAVRQHVYHRWWFYPFIHWYDVLGCIPVGSFRWLRLLRVVSIVYRLEKKNIIDISSTPPVRFVIKYANVVMEEISNRVVVNVLSSLQDEIRKGTPVVNNIIEQVIRPRVPELLEWLRHKVHELSEHGFEAKKDAVRQYIDTMVADTFAANSGIHALEKVAVMGVPIAKIVERGVSQLIYDMADHVTGDIAKADTDLLIAELTDAISEKMVDIPPNFRNATREIAIEALEVVKDQAKVQKWKLAEAAERDRRRQALPV